MPQRDTSTLFDHLPIGAYRCAPDGSLLRANAAYVKLNGYDTEAAMKADLLANPRSPYVNPKRRERLMASLQAHAKVSNFVSERVKLKTGEHIWVREHVHVVRDRFNQVEYFEGTVEDITLERAAKTSLAQSEALLKNIVQTIPDDVWLKNLDGVYITCNDSYAATFGLSPSDIIGTRDVHWVEESVASHFLKTDQAAVQAGHPITFEEDITSQTNPNGELHEVVKAPMRSADGTIVGVLGMSRNIHQRKLAEATLRDTSEQLELAIMGADLGRWNHDLTREWGYFLDARACKLLGRHPDGADNGRAWGHLVHPDDLPAAMQAMRAHLSGATPAYQSEYRARHTDGRWIWLSSRGKVVQFAQDGTPQRMVGTLMDISARKLAEDQLRATQAELQATLSALPDLLFEFNAQGQYRAVHSRDVSMLAYPAEFLLNKSVDEVLPKDAADACMTALREAHVTGRSNGIQYSMKLPTADLWFELSVVRKPTLAGEEERFIVIARDISERKAAEEAIRHLAFHDTLTGLPNRRMLTDRLQRAISASGRSQAFGAIMFLDLDKFKELNDSHGHEVGDLLLQEVARRLQQSVRAVDTVARLGGDEFVVLSQDLSAERDDAFMHASTVGHKILASLNDEFVLNDRFHHTTPSIGITLFCGDAQSPNDLLKQADLAMYQAKSQGRNTLSFYLPNQ